MMKQFCVELCPCYLYLVLIRRIILDVLRVPGLCVTRRAAGLTMARRRPSAGCAWSQIKKLDTAEGTNIAVMPPDARVVQRNAGPTAQCRNPTTAIMHCTTALHYCTTALLQRCRKHRNTSFGPSLEPSDLNAHALVDMEHRTSGCIPTYMQ